MRDWIPREEKATEPLVIDAAAQRVPGGGLVSGIAGVLVCVLLIMTVGLVVAKIVSGPDHQPGPDPLAIGAHVAGLLVGVVGYRMTRRPGLGRALGLAGVLVATVLLLWFFWWSPT